MALFQEFSPSQTSPQRSRYRSLDEDTPPSRTREEYRQILKIVKTKFKGGFGLSFKIAFLDFSQRLKMSFSFGLARTNLARSRAMFISFLYKLLKSPILPRVPAGLRRVLNKTQMKLLLAIMKALQEHRDFSFREERRNRARVRVLSGERASSVDVALIPDISSQIDNDLLYYRKKTSEAKLECRSAWVDLELERMLQDVSERKRSAQELWRA